MLEVTVERTYPVSPVVLFGELRHLERHVEWMHDALAISFTTNQREGVGTEFTCLTKVGFVRTRDRMTITAWEEPRVIGVAHRGLVTGEGHFTLQPSGSGTTLTWRERLELPWWFAGPLGALVAGPVLRAIWRRNLALLARRFPTADASDLGN